MSVLLASAPHEAGKVSAGALAGLLLSMLMSSLATSVANVALPTLAQVFAARFQEVQWIVLAYLLAVTTLIVGIGRLGDIVGRKRLLIVGIGVFTAASMLCGLAPNLSALIAARALQGLGAAAMMTLALALVGETAPKEKLGAAMGLLGATSAIGTALGPSIGGFLLAALDWRAVFLLNAPLGLVALALAWRCLPADRATMETPRPRFDWVGTLLLGLTLGAYALAATVGHGRFGVVNVALLFVAAFGLGLFSFAEARTASPLIHTSMVREPRFATGLSTSAIVAAVMMTTLIVGPFYLSNALGHGALVVGLAMSAGPMVAALTGAPAGRLVDRLGAERSSLGGLAGIAAGCTLLAVAPESLGLAGYLAPIALVTASYALFQAANNTMMIASATASDRGLVSGLLNLSRNLGLLTGAAMMGAFFAFAVGATDVAQARPEAIAYGMRITFLMGAAFVVLAMAIALAGARAQRSPA